MGGFSPSINWTVYFPLKTVYFQLITVYFGSWTVYFTFQDRIFYHLIGIFIRKNAFFLSFKRLWSIFRAERSVHSFTTKDCQIFQILRTRRFFIEIFLKHFAIFHLKNAYSSYKKISQSSKK